MTSNDLVHHRIQITVAVHDKPKTTRSTLIELLSKKDKCFGPLLAGNPAHEANSELALRRGFLARLSSPVSSKPNKRSVYNLISINSMRLNKPRHKLGRNHMM